ncbi:MAG: exosortase system-associated protein, TIGR04073 family [Candidatus Omnitrophica bacterium]|nr:exosortase system-associated protein, TIGR04073 family [Candidatus Omnitrophota bacterium]
MMKQRVGLLVVSLLLVSQPVFAARLPVHEAAESSVYSRKAGGMLGRGLLNAATCFVDLLVNTVNGTKSGPPLVGTLTGVAKGAGCTVLRAGSGVIDVATFWVPGFNGFPVSDSYEDCMNVGPTTISANPTSTPEASIATTPTGESSEGQITASEGAPGSTTTSEVQIHRSKRVWKK